MGTVGRPRILVVDDEPAVRAVLRRLLQARGCSVAEAAGSIAALHLLEEGDFDAVISDFHMPGLDGGQLWALAATRRPNLRRRFLFVSALPPPQEVIVQGVPHVAKPFELEDVWAELRKILEQPAE